MVVCESQGFASSAFNNFFCGLRTPPFRTTFLVVVVTVRYLRLKGKMKTDQINMQPVVVLSLLLGLAIGYIMIIVLLLHEGVDHAL